MALLLVTSKLRGVGRVLNVLNLYKYGRQVGRLENSLLLSPVQRNYLVRIVRQRAGLRLAWYCVNEDPVSCIYGRVA